MDRRRLESSQANSARDYEPRMSNGPPGRRRRMALAISAMAALSGCKLHYEVDASVQGHILTFVLPDRPRQACLESFEVKRRDGGIVWRLSKVSGASACSATLPIQYGVVPAGLSQTVAPAELQPGVAYDIMGSGSGAYSGAFKLLANGQVLNRWTEY